MTDRTRMKWTPELHAIFIDTCARLGGIYKAKPVEIMRLMNIPEISRDHVKSYLQKLRKEEDACNIALYGCSVKNTDATKKYNEICGLLNQAIKQMPE
ncbi:SANT superfamily protein [Tetraselmis virus 1]|uniref:SANT superfamily protein n=1 Tax=Tetraselmis virus 1 TaxID=2060617 RepID=A0A2P0VMQ4_9VIRU|nr:SANT superfamily protein [Tetraselmis virus 1]AUF82187.1 SANT superfamily protein [Tetraselmis virus 1]